MGNVIKITLKDPDGVYESITNFVDENIPDNLDEEEKILLKDVKRDWVSRQLSKFIQWGEYLTVEIDLEAGTAKIVENK